MIGFSGRIVFAACLAVGLSSSAVQAAAVNTQVERGKYLVAVIGCGDCHTPGSLLGKPDMARFLAGSEVGFEVPGLGIFAARNLTPDPDTGLGNWTQDQIIAAMTTGMRPDGRALAPIMPWRGFAKLTKPDAIAIAAYLKSLPPVKNPVAGPFGPGQKPSIFVSTTLSGDVYGFLRPVLKSDPPGK